MLVETQRLGRVLGIISQIEELIATGNFLQEDTDDLEKALKYLCWYYRDLA
jgi:hypothetical protein